MADCTSLQVSRLSGANYLRAVACPSQGPPVHAALTLRPCSPITAGYLRAGRVNFTKCHLVYFWQRLTREQKIGFEAAYRTSCKCQVSSFLSMFSWQPGSLSLSHFLGPGASSLSSPSLDDPRLLPFFFPVPCPLPPFLLASPWIETPVALVFLEWGCEQQVGRKYQRVLYLPSPLGSTLPPLLAWLP